MNIFKMTPQELDAWAKTPEGKKVFQEMADMIEKEFEEESKKPHSYLLNQNCLCTWCELNSHHKEEYDMGTITYCTKYKNTDPESICKDREFLEMRIGK